MAPVLTKTNSAPSIGTCRTSTPLYKADGPCKSDEGLMTNGSGSSDISTCSGESSPQSSPDQSPLSSPAPRFRQLGVDTLSRQSSNSGLDVPTGNDLQIPYLTPESAGYKVVGEIAKVNQGAIKLASKFASGEQHCIKCYDKSEMKSETLEFLKSEAEFMFDFGKHPNIGGAVRIFQDHLSYYLVQPYYRGGNLVGLKKRVESAGIKTNEDWWTKLFRQCLEGLSHLHSRGIMHCDIKEPNMMLKDEDFQDPQVVIIDLGIAQVAKTKRTVIYGTPGYIPPEVWADKNWHPESDMFSFGVVVLQALLGKIGIFTDGTENLKEIREATKTRFPPVASIPIGFRHLRWLARALLEKDPSARPTAADLLQKQWGENDYNDCVGERHFTRSTTGFLQTATSRDGLQPSLNIHRASQASTPSNTPIRKLIGERERSNTDISSAQSIRVPLHSGGSISLLRGVQTPRVNGSVTVPPAARDYIVFSPAKKPS